MFCPQFPSKTTGKISHSPIHQGLICNIYLPMVNWWMACIYPNNGVHFHFMKNPYVLCYVMDIKLIDVINVSYMCYRSYLLQILAAFSEWIVKWKENRKTEDSWFWWQMEAGYMGMGVRRPKYFTIYYRSTRSLEENMRICQGNLREFSGKNCPTFIAINQLAVKITRRSLSFGCICINSSTYFKYLKRTGEPGNCFYMNVCIY